jgi:hypothetical protein
MSQVQEQLPDQERVKIQVMAADLGVTVKKMAVTAETQQISILGLAAILACLPDTAAIPEERLTAALAILSKGRSSAFKKKLAMFIAMGVATSRQIPAVAEKIKAGQATKN